MAVLRVTQAFAVLSDPNGRVYTPGDVVDSTDPVVKGHEGNFETVEATVARTTARPVEQATAAPGERRAPVVPAKRGGYASPKAPVTSLPKVPSGPAPGATG